MIEKARDLIKKASKLAILTGAGVSAESGIPTFRGKSGYYKNVAAEKLASKEGFLSDPTLVWEWYQERRALLKKVKPNPAHYAIANWSNVHGTPVITQNVDGLHKKAGAEKVFEIHGDVEQNYCENCNYKGAESITENFPLLHCLKCGSLMRPAVVWFGENLDRDILSQVYQHVASSDLLLVVGTSGLVYPAAALAVEFRKKQLPVIEVNIERPDFLHSSDIFLEGKAGDIIPALLDF